jgi:adenosylhomocysteinase
MSFANQALAVKWLVENKGKLQNKVYGVPEEIDREVAKRKLKTMGIRIDKLTREQIKYMKSWKEGT